MDSDIEILVEIVDTVAQVTLRGQVDFSNCHELRQLIDDQLDAGVSKFILDGKELNFIDSSCLGMLVAALRRIKEHRGRMIFVVNSHIERVLTVSGLNSLFEVEHTFMAAVEGIKS